MYFPTTGGGAELVLLPIQGSKHYGFEGKLADTPGTTRSMREALSEMEPERLSVVHPGRER